MDSSSVLIRVVREYVADDLPEWLSAQAKKTGQSISKLCATAGITTQYWYDLVNNRKDLRLDTLEKIESALGVRYEPKWRTREDEFTKKSILEASDEITD